MHGRDAAGPSATENLPHATHRQPHRRGV